MWSPSIARGEPCVLLFYWSIHRKRRPWPSSCPPCLPTPGRGRPPPRAREVQELIEQAEKAAKRLESARARELWARINELKPSTMAVCQLGVFDLGLGRLEEAAAELLTCVAQMPAPTNDIERRRYEVRRGPTSAAVRQRVAELPPSAPPGTARLLVDGREVSAGGPLLPSTKARRWSRAPPMSASGSLNMRAELTPSIFITTRTRERAAHQGKRRRRLDASGPMSPTPMPPWPRSAKPTPDFGEVLIDRIGGEQVRNMGTIGGNIANGSPIGDTPPPLIALGATVTLRRREADAARLPLEDFFIAYGKQDRQTGEFVESVFVPALPPGELFAVYKLTKRPRRGHLAPLAAPSAFARCTATGRGRRPHRLRRHGGDAEARCAAVEDALHGQALERGNGRSRPGGVRRRLSRRSTDLARASAALPHSGGEEPADAPFPRNDGDRDRRLESGETLSGGGAHGQVSRPSKTPASRPAACARPAPRFSAHKHVTGTADYIDDLPEACRHAAWPRSACPTGHMPEINRHGPFARSRVRPASSGFSPLATCPARTTSAPAHKHDEPVLAEDIVEFHGQPIFAVIAETREIARARRTQGKDRISRPAALERYRRRA